ncbi:MAG: PAS domain S-box protein [Bacteroidetes bacterium]|nr:PAS domain S-box protein [Bacteroidota bacterium]
MDAFKFEFGRADFDKIFPFYFLMDQQSNIQYFGSSLSKLLPELKKGQSFSDFFYLKRPFLNLIDFSKWDQVVSQLIIIESINDDTICLKGQFEKHNEFLLFVGSPWFSSIQEVNNKGLSIRDFAIHDPLMDLLHVLKNQEITNEELKDLLKTINDQRVNLRKDKEELNKLSLVASANKKGIVFTDFEGVVFWINDAYLKLTANTKEEVIGKTLLEVGQSEQTNKEDLKKMLKAFENRKTFDCEVLHKKKNNQFFWSRMKGQCVLDESGQPSHYFVIVEDITKEKDFNDKLKESENRLYSLIINLQTGVLLEDENRKILLVNQCFCDMFGIKAPPKDMIGADCTNSAEEAKSFFKNQEEFVRRIDEILERKETVLSELLELADGRFFERTYTPVFTDGVYRGHLWSYNDISLRIKYRENLESEKEKYRAIIDNMNIGLMEVDNNDVIQLVNQRFSEMSGYSVEDLIGKKGAEVFLEPNQRQIIKKQTENRISGLSGSYEVTVKTKKGEFRDWLVSGAPNYNEKGEVVGSIGLHFDVTEKNVFEAQKEDLLLKLEAQNEYLNEYAQIVSHDLKSPLRSIHALVTWIKEENRTGFNSNTQKYFSLIMDKVEKMDFLINGLLSYAKIEADMEIKEPLHLNDLVSNVVSTIFIPEHIEIVVGELPHLNANRIRMFQLFQNLITNAVNYNDKVKGYVEVGSEEHDDYYVIFIKDNGPGIADEYKDKVFKIFQSLHENQESTGIGLSIVKKIIESQHGKIWIESKPNQGAAFYFTLNKES